MWRSDRKARARLALLICLSVAGTKPALAQNESTRDRPERHPSESMRQTPHPQAQTSPNHTGPVRLPAASGSAHVDQSYSRQRQVVNGPREVAGRIVATPHPNGGGVMGQTRFANGGGVRVVSRSFAGGRVQVTRFGGSVSGSFEHTIRPGLVSRTYVGGGRVLYAHVYQTHMWRQYGRTFAYETFVPAVRFPEIYYAWALAAWSRPISYSWGWQVQPWYPVYGAQFTPYPEYTSPDLWMTDYLIAQNMQTAYQAQSTAPAPAQAPASAPAPESEAAPSAAQIDNSTVASAPGDATAQAGDTPVAPEAPPPAITPAVKAQLNAQIKVQLQEQQAAAVTPVTLTSQSGPPALRPNHVFFEVVQPIEVPTGSNNGHCSLNANDYIKRTGAMSNDDWMIPVVVELSRPSDCPEGLTTRIGLNDLNAMENEQEAQVLAAMQAASKSMGPNGPPSGPGLHPTLIADGNAAPDPMALDAVRQTQ